ncbi:tRNA pseudouridine(38-40) synthase TruA [Streptomyces sp. MAR4 CNX-425]|uniref:tRNA pseudouridine(38-40) synthase TruA n=1 Tax=Streptomyces sp. MAR4 CNX-425 TaxID=3406343 RepID=UPI003B50318D
MSDEVADGFVRVRLDLSYDGSGFSGWARQREGQRTVQEELETALQVVLRQPGPYELTVAGRTDAGVHARGQVAHVDLPADVWTGQGTGTGAGAGTRGASGAPGEVLLRRLAGRLPHDVRVWRVTEAPPHFNARFSAIWRRYAYRVGDDPGGVDPLLRGHVLWHNRPLDAEAMNAAAERLLGEHDFAAFCKRREGATTIRRLLELRWERRADGLLEATVKADAFCHNMVRALVGAMLFVGDGHREPEWAGRVLGAAVRDSAVQVVRPHGLTLEEVGYPAEAELAARNRASRRVRTLGTG